MKEYTITYTAEVTQVVRSLKDLTELFNDPGFHAENLKRDAQLDDVHVKNVKVFERETE